MTVNLKLISPTFEVAHDFGTHLMVNVPDSMTIGEFREKGGGRGPQVFTGGHGRDSILADALEAVFAAVYLDGGYDRTRQVILALFRERLDGLSLDSQRKDPKTLLQELLQSRGLPLPNYEIMAVTGQSHAQHFRVQCRVDGLDTETEGSGASRKKAEQDAAQRLLDQLNL